MSDPRLRRTSILIIAAGLAGLACFVMLNRRAFPQAAVELAVDRNAAYERAAEFVAARGVAPGGREHAITMSSDGAAAVFLQRTPPVAGEPDLADMRIWHWRARWFRSQEKEEVGVDVGPRGQILSYEHLIPEAQAGTRIDLAAARSMAEHFLTEVMHVDLRTLEEVEAASKQLDHRVDHTFEWRVLGYERPYRGPEAARAAARVAEGTAQTAGGTAAEADTALGGAGTLRHRMRIQGDEVGLYEFDYKVPEAFEREFSAATSRGLLLTIVAFVLLIVLGIAAVVVMVRAQRTAGLRFRPSMALGAVVLLANLVTTINLWPQLEASYSTQIPYPVFIGIALAGTLLVALIYGFIVLACAASGDHLARDVGLTPSRALGPVPRPSFVAATRARLQLRVLLPRLRDPLLPPWPALLRRLDAGRRAVLRSAVDRAPGARPDRDLDPGRGLRGVGVPAVRHSRSSAASSGASSLPARRSGSRSSSRRWCGPSRTRTTRCSRSGCAASSSRSPASRSASSSSIPASSRW